MSLTRPEHPWRVAIIVVAAVVLVNVVIWGGRSQVNGPPNAQQPVEIQQRFPDEGGSLLPQGTVGADFRDQFTGQITIDGRLIPKDQTSGDPSLGIVLFSPGPGKEFREFTKGPHNAVLEWWPRTIATPEEAAKKQQLRSFGFSFNVG